MAEAMPFRKAGCTAVPSDPVEVAEGFGDERLAAAWREHRVWVALDLMNSDVGKKQAYRVLPALAGQLLDVRCARSYLPKENRFTIGQYGPLKRIVDAQV